MRAKLQPPNYSRYTILVFGLMAFVVGAAGLLWPSFTMKAVGFPSSMVDSSECWPHWMAVSIAATNMGAYYILAARANVKAFFRWTVPFRMLTCTVFAWAVFSGKAPASPYLTTSIVEGLGALSTGLALWYEGEYQRSGFLL